MVPAVLRRPTAHAALMTAGGFAFTGYLLTLILGASHPGWLLVWFVGAIVLHDLVFLPLYSVLDRLLTARTPAGGSGRSAVRQTWINHVRVPAVVSGVLLLVSFPLVLRLFGQHTQTASGLGKAGDLLRWLLVAAGLFAVSAVLYLVRRARWRRHADWNATTVMDTPVLDATTTPAPLAFRQRRVPPPGRMAERLVGSTIVRAEHRSGGPLSLCRSPPDPLPVRARMDRGRIPSRSSSPESSGTASPDSPSLHFTPWPYTPLYFWVSAGVAELTGIGFTPLRLVWFAASLAVLWLLYRMVADESSDRVAGIVAVGVFAATFRLSGAWADIGRVDSLFLALTLRALQSHASCGDNVRDGVIVGVLFFLSFFTKQDGLLVAPQFHHLARSGRQGAGVGAVFAALGGLVVGFDRRSRRLHPWLVPVLRLRRVAVPGLGRRERPVLLATQHLQAVRAGGVARRRWPSRGAAGAGASSARPARVAAWLLDRGGSRIARGRMDRAPAQRRVRRRADACTYAAVALFVGAPSHCCAAMHSSPCTVAASVVLAGLLAVQFPPHRLSRRSADPDPGGKTAGAGAAPDRADPPSSGSGTRLRPPVLRRDSA